MTPAKFDSKKYLYLLDVFMFSLFVLYLFQYTDFSNPLLRNFDSFLLPFAYKVMTGTYNFVSLIVNIILLESILASSFSLLNEDASSI